jgi:c-di-GMP-binding flagellar brake protein YcgR
MSQNKSGFHKERRKHPRLIVQIWAVEKNDNSRSFHLLTNLSIGGFFIEKRLPFQVGSKVNLDLDIDGELLSLRGKIVNNYKNPVTDHTGAGVQFVEMDERVKTKIKDYLKKLEKADQFIA